MEMSQKTRGKEQATKEIERQPQHGDQKNTRSWKTKQAKLQRKMRLGGSVPLRIKTENIVIMTSTAKRDMSRPHSIC